MSRARVQKEMRPRRGSNDKENKRGTNSSFRTNGRLRSIKTQKNIELDNDDESNDVNEAPLEKLKEENEDLQEEEPKVNGDHSKFNVVIPFC